MNLNLIAPINQVSYGLVSLNIVKELAKQNHNVALWPLGQIIVEPSDGPIIERAIERNNMPDWSAPSLKIFHQFAMSESIGKGIRIGFPIFELEQFTDVEEHHLSSLDKIFVCSEWAKRVVLSHTKLANSSVCVVPLGVDRSIYHENVVDNRKDNDSTNFLHIGKWEIRKGHDIILEAFNKTFTPKDNVKLIMHSHCSHPQSVNRNEEWNLFYKSSKLSDKITIVTGRFGSCGEVAQLIAMADCGLFPSRAEGWGMPILEMMAMGKPIITTNCTGQTEYATPENAMLIDVNHKEKAYDRPWFTGQGEWNKIGKPQLDHLCEYMSIIHELKQSGKLLQNTAGIETSKKFSWTNTGNAIIRAIKES